MRAVKVNRTLYPKSGYLSDSYQFTPKSALFRLRTRQKSQAAHSSLLRLTKNVKIFNRKNYSRFCAKFEKARLCPLVCLALRHLSRPRKAIDHAIALSREDVPLSARFDSNYEVHISTAQNGADLCRQMTDNAIALSREDVPLSARFDSNYEMCISAAQTGADLRRQMTDNAIALSREDVPLSARLTPKFRGACLDRTNR